MLAGLLVLKKNVAIWVLSRISGLMREKETISPNHKEQRILLALAQSYLKRKKP